MGLWGGFKNLVRKAVDTGKKVVNKVIDTGKKVVNKTKECVTNLWNKFSGKDKFEEAERLYNRITEKYNKRRQEFESDLNEYTNRIEAHVNVINHSKKKIKQELFPAMANKLNKIKDISISKEFSIEEYVSAVLSVDSVRSKSELYKIDFNKHKVKTTCQAIFTLGFYTRKKAKETLYAVQEEEQKINCEIAKMDAEITKLKAIEQALNNVEEYFTSIIPMYENLLIRLDNSVNFLYFRCMSLVHKLVAQEMSIKKLPAMQIKEIEAIVTASKILKGMVETQILSVEENDKVTKYDKDIKAKQEEMLKVYNAA